MRIQTFLTKAANISGKMTSEEFLESEEIRNYLCQFDPVLPVLAMFEKKYDNGSRAMLPTPALQMICQIMATIPEPLPMKSGIPLTTGTSEQIANSIEAEEAKEAGKRGKEKAPRKYFMFMFLTDGTMQEIDCGTEESYMKVQNLADRKNFQNQTHFIDIIGLGLCTRIDRSDSIARILARGPSPTMKKQKKTTTTLKFVAKAKSDTAKFSRG